MVTLADGPTSQRVRVESFKAGADLSTKQFYFVKLSADRTVIVCAAATDKPIGILQNKPDAADKAAEVLMTGRSKLSADVALAAGDLVGTSGDGQGDVKVAGTDTTHYICGQVTLGVSNAAEIAEVEIDCVNIARAA